MAEQFRQTVLKLLETLPSRQLDALKQLFWSELNYDRANAPLSTRDWKDELRQLMVEPPLLFATAGDGNGFHVIYCHLKGDLRLMDERILVNRLLADQHLFALFIFSDETRSNWHFVNVKYRRDEKSTAQRVLRRISVCGSSYLRTPAERLSLLDVNTMPANLLGIPVMEIQRRHDEAFDVEAVTRNFFKIYRELFQAVEASLPLSTALNEEKRRLFTQRFFNRLVFLMFLERKGWLAFQGKAEYLRALWQDYEQNETDKLGGRGFHRSRLNTLFFNTLNNRLAQNLTQDPDYAVFRQKVGDAPYLNGGLFEEEEGDNAWFFPDIVITYVLENLLYAFNFTITESTPLDVEVAVDPEMLGKIFEELVTGRHETGSYYTPKPVVAFMCRAALKSHLKDRCPGEARQALEAFVEEHNPAQITNPEKVLAALREIRVCDPACGSGAYLLGMLHELLDLRDALFSTHQLDARTVYERKLEIIQNSLYGVDKDAFAVNIARLRLWLSLVVDDTRNPLQEPGLDVSLPNLDFKIEAGDSLTAADPSGGLELGIRSGLVDDYLRAKEQFLRAHGQNKLDLRKKVLELKQDIRNWAGRDGGMSGKNAPAIDLKEEFDWAIEFAEVFTHPQPEVTLGGGLTAILNQTAGQMELPAAAPAIPGGFDVVLANPPYVRADAQFKHIEDETERQAEISRWKAYREHLKHAKIYDTLYEKWDLYIPFLERAHQLLRPGGQMVFIIPDAYNTAKYAKKSHEFFLVVSRVERIDFCSEINLFDAGVNNTILHFGKFTTSASHQPIRVRRWGNNQDEFESNQDILETATQIEFGVPLFRNNVSNSVKSKTSFPILELICYVSKGMVIHADERKAHLSFLASDLISDTQDSTHPKPFVEGKDLVKWINKRVHYLEYGTKRAPILFSRPTFPELYQVPEKLISMDLAGEEPKVVYDNQQLYHNHSGWSFVLWKDLKAVQNKSISKTAKYKHQDPLGNREIREKTSQNFNLKYVLAIMNSSFTCQWFKGKRQSKMHIYPNDWKQVPIPPIPMEEQMAFVELVDQILAQFKQHGYPLPSEAAQRVAALERQLDGMVAALYQS